MVAKTLSILHVSDVHSSFENIEALEKWLKEKGESIDLLLLSGDIADMPMEYGYDNSEIAEKFKKSYYKDFEKHDVPSLFKQDTTISPPCNAHCRYLKVTDNLFIAGFGGSVPGYQDGQQVWEGFPFRSQVEMDKPLDQLLGTLCSPETTPLKDPNDRLILMTHIGPNDSSTTIFKRDPAHPIYSGSTGLDKWLLNSEIQSRVLINIHGHTHPSYGEVQVGNVSILNAGSLLESRFALYSMSYKTNEEGGVWKLESTRRYNL